MFRHPVAAVVLAVLGFMWVSLGWIGPAALAAWAVAVLVIWRCYWPGSFARWVMTPARGTWRAFVYRRRWPAVMSIADLAPWYQARIILPVLGKVTATRYVDRVQVRLVSGQSPADFADRADNLAHGFGALLCRVRSARSGSVVLEFVRRDALAAIIPALPAPDRPDLRALPVGRREDGLPWLVRLHGTHLLIAGATGAGKASLLWGLIRAMLPLMREGLVRVLAADPKLMELAYGRVIFDTYGHAASGPQRVCPRPPVPALRLAAARPTTARPTAAAAAGSARPRPARPRRRSPWPPPSPRPNFARRRPQPGVEHRPDDRDPAGHAELLGGREDPGRRAGPLGRDVGQRRPDQRRQRHALAQADHRGRRRKIPAR